MHWSVQSILSVTGIGLVLIARWIGLLQTAELDALDNGLRWRLPEATDERIVIVGINEADIQSLGTYPISDDVIAQLLQQLQSYNPRAIGLDLVRDIPVEPGHDELVQAFQTMPNVIGAFSVIPDVTGTTIEPPPALPSEQIGFVDALLDGDGLQRRALLGAQSQSKNVFLDGDALQRRALLGANAIDGSYRFSMAIQLASLYLRQEGLELENGIRNPVAMRFGGTELPVIQSNSGGYVGADDGGNQTLIHFRSGSQPFHFVSLTDVLEGLAGAEVFRDRVVLVGVTAQSTKDYAQSAAISSAKSGVVFGIEIHAHILSQILSATLDGRPQLKTLPDIFEYLWITIWGLIGIVLFKWVQRPGLYFWFAALTLIALIGISQGILIMGWWLPFIPALISVLIVNGISLYTLDITNRSLQSRIHDRQLVIDQTFTAIHNGPLQTLAATMRSLENPDYSQQKLQADLTLINQEIRGVYAGIKDDAVQDNRLHLQGDVALDLTAPLHEVLYEVYNDTLRRDFPYFSSLKVHVVKFEPFDEAGLTGEHKRNLCRFLEEALCNVGKHAMAARRLTVDCRHDGHQNVIRVVDNGTTASISSPLPIQKAIQQGRGTQQSKQLALQLGGTFERSPHSPKGTRCELTWLPKHSIWKRWGKRWSQQLAYFCKQTD